MIHDREGVVVRRRVAGDLLIDLGQRDRACAVAAAHDRQGVLDQGIGERDAEDGAGDAAEDRRSGKAAQDRRDIAREGLQKNVLLQSEHRSHDQHDDEEGQEVRVVGDEAVDGVKACLRDQLKLAQDRDAEEGEQQAAADVGVPDRDALAELIENDRQATSLFFRYPYSPLLEIKNGCPGRNRNIRQFLPRKITFYSADWQTEPTYTAINPVILRYSLFLWKRKMKNLHKTIPKCYGFILFSFILFFCTSLPAPPSPVRDF